MVAVGYDAQLRWLGDCKMDGIAAGHDYTGMLCQGFESVGGAKASLPNSRKRSLMAIPFGI